MAGAQKRNRKKEQRRHRIEAEIRRHQAMKRRRLMIQAGVLVVVAAAAAGLIYKSKRSTAKPAPTPTPSATTKPSPSAHPSTSAALGPVACGAAAPAPPVKVSSSTPPAMSISSSKHYSATVETSCGTVVMELAASTQPKTVNSFVYLARARFFDGLTFHRVVKDFAIQGGDPKGDGTGGPGYSVTEAPPAGVKYVKGTVAMAKTGAEAAGTSGSQFFIVPGDQAATLPPDYAVLGKVASGQEVLDRIQAVAESTPERPDQKIYINRITIAET